MGMINANGNAPINFMGIDPGKTGAVALIDMSEGEVSLLLPIPYESKIKEVNFYRLKEIFDICRKTPVFCILEKATARPGQGVVSMFSYGSTYGGILALLATSNISFETVSPATWKRKMELSSTKKDSVSKATRLYPGTVDLIGQDHNKAEAVLLAEYAKRRYYGKFGD